MTGEIIGWVLGLTVMAFFVYMVVGSSIQPTPSETKPKAMSITKNFKSWIMGISVLLAIWFFFNWTDSLPAPYGGYILAVAIVLFFIGLWLGTQGRRQ